MKTIRFALTAILTMSLVACGGGGGGGTTASTSAIFGLALDSNVAPTKLLVVNGGYSDIQSMNLSNSFVSSTPFAGAANTAGTTDGSGTAARFNAPYGIALSGSDYYVADTGNHTIRKITSAGAVSTVAGSAGNAGATDGDGSAARLNWPKGLVSDGTFVYITENADHTIRKMSIASPQTVTTIAGYAGTAGVADNNDGRVARFYYPFGIAYDGTKLYVTDAGNHTIRTVTTSGSVGTLAGTAGTSGTSDSTGTSAKFYYPAGIVFYNDPNVTGGVLFVADSGNHTIRRIVISSGAVTTFAGSAGNAGLVDASGTAARFSTPFGLTIDPTNGVLYVSDQNYTKVRKIVIGTGAVSGAVTTLSASF